MNIAPYTANYYPELKRWWRGHRWEPVPAHLIPKFAFLAIDGNIPRAFACAYLDAQGTGVAMLTWLLANPDNSARQSYRALNTIIPLMRDELVELGYKQILTTSAHPALVKIFEKHRFQQAGKNYTELIYAHGP